MKFDSSLLPRMLDHVNMSRTLSSHSHSHSPSTLVLLPADERVRCALYWIVIGVSAIGVSRET